MVLEILDEQLFFFKSKYDLNAFFYSKFPDFDIPYTLFAMNKGSSVFITNSSSQANQDEYVVCDFVKPDGGDNWLCWEYS